MFRSIAQGSNDFNSILSVEAGSRPGVARAMPSIRFVAKLVRWPQTAFSEIGQAEIPLVKWRQESPDVAHRSPRGFHISRGYAMKKILVNTGVALPPHQIQFLKEAALARKRARGGRGRASVSAYLGELIERAMSDERLF